MDKKGKRSTVPTPGTKTLNPLAIVTEGKLSRENKKENKDWLLVVWSDEGGSTIDDCEGGSIWATVAEQGG